MRSYRQYCGLAKALDVIGGRWSLLIVRELMLQGPCRYTDLLNGLPGIATNLLAERLTELEAAGVVTREAAPPPVATTLFTLTARGEALRPVIREIGRWGAPLLYGQNQPGDSFHTYWMALPLELYYRDPRPEAPTVEIELRTGDEPMVIATIDGTIRARRGTAGHPDLVLTGPPRLVIGVLSKRVGPDQAMADGLQIEGDLEALDRIATSTAVGST